MLAQWCEPASHDRLVRATAAAPEHEAAHAGAGEIPFGALPK